MLTRGYSITKAVLVVIGFTLIGYSISQTLLCLGIGAVFAGLIY